MPYEQAPICWRYYAADDLPSDEVLEADLRDFLDMYRRLVSLEETLFSRADAEDDENDLGDEDLRTLRIHKRIERNRKLAQRAKKLLGHTCQACGFNFEAVYGEIGRDFIEAHHLIPLAELKAQKVFLDPAKDFAVLCSNCHRMVHRTEFVSDIASFKNQHIGAK
jgi:5-methylcytosine-specific restriction enzyme A